MADKEVKSEEITEEKLQKALDGLDNLIKSADVVEDEDNEDNEDDKKKEVVKTCKKSFVEKATEGSEELKKGVEVSDFLSELVNQIGESIDSINTLQKSQLAKTNNNIVELAKSLKGIGEALSDMSERIEAVEKAPLTVKKSVLSKSEKGVQRFEDGKELSKSQVLNKMTNLFQKGDGSVTESDVIRFETSGAMRPEVKEIIYS